MLRVARRSMYVPSGWYRDPCFALSLGGLASVKEEGPVVSGSGVIPVNAQQRMGTLPEAVTVTTHPPIVDTQSTRSETVLGAQTINTPAATRGYNVCNGNFAAARRVSEAGTFPALESPYINHVVENHCSGDDRAGRIQWRRLQSRSNSGAATGDAADAGRPGGCACRAG
jgi:hypothetical protein